MSDTKSAMAILVMVLIGIIGIVVIQSLEITRTTLDIDNSTDYALNNTDNVTVWLYPGAVTSPMALNTQRRTLTFTVYMTDSTDRNFTVYLNGASLMTQQVTAVTPGENTTYTYEKEITAWTGSSLNLTMVTPVNTGSDMILQNTNLTVDEYDNTIRIILMVVAVLIGAGIMVGTARKIGLSS